MEGIVESEGGREGEGDRSGDESSLDRRLAQRLYLVLQDEDGSWAFPQRAWQPPERARDGLHESGGDRGAVLDEWPPQEAGAPPTREDLRFWMDATLHV